MMMAASAALGRNEKGAINAIWRLMRELKIVKGAVEKGILVNLIVNNRVGGNAPLIAREIAERLIPKSEPEVKRKRQLSLW